jgi:hypothetical protein
MISLKTLSPFALSLALVACGPTTPAGRDGSTTGDAAAVTDTGVRADSGTSRPDAMTNSDRCAATDMNANSTVGCNGGFAMGTPAMNTPGGTCTGGGMAMPAGSCGANMQCSADMGAMGICFAGCMPGSTYVSTGGCPTGSRCFDLMGNGLCFLDCDATHACPNGMMCDGEGSCVPPMMGKAN